VLCRADGAKGEAASGSNREGESTDAGRRGGAARSGVEGPVMGPERRGCVVRPWPSANWKREEPVDEAKPFKIPKREVWEAFKRVKANQGAAGVDGQSIAEFEANLSGNLYKLWNRLSSGSYFPPPVLRVEIPKASGGMRPLGIPTVADRIAQEVARRYLEPVLEPVFHADSYGYRPGKSAIDAVHQARQRRWRYDWVLDLDIKGFFDSIDWELLLKAVRHHTDCPWVLLYIERWLKAPVQMEDGSIMPRTAGTPQGGVISPLLANLFLHYSFDMWMVRTFPHIPFERYADDAICHCKSAEEARALWGVIADRFAACKLTSLQKTKIVYCKDVNRRGDFPDIHFDFLGFKFRARKIMWVKPDRRIFLAQLPARCWSEGVDAHQSRDTWLGAASPQRQIFDRTSPDVQSVHPRLDQLLRPLLQDAIASDPEADRCLCHPVGASQVQATTPPVLAMWWWGPALVHWPVLVLL
jgi:RNA-directed DNA polymerase